MGVKDALAGSCGSPATSLFREELYGLRTTLSPASRVVLNSIVRDVCAASTAQLASVGPVALQYPQSW